MKINPVKIVGIILAGIAGIVLIGFVIYVILYYPRKAESFEFNAPPQTKNILIATQGSDFKDMLTSTLCDSLRGSSVFIKGIDVKKLSNVNEEDWDKILIINSS